MVSPWFAPELAFDEREQLWMAYVDNRNAYGGEAWPLRVVRWNEAGGWSGLDDGYEDLYFAIFPALAVYDNVAWVAYSTMEFTTEESQKKYGRYTRHVELLRVSPTGPTTNLESKVFETYNHGYGPDGDEVLRYGRSVRPAVFADQDGVTLAYIGYDGDDNQNSARPSPSRSLRKPTSEPVSAPVRRPDRVRSASGSSTRSP